MFFIYTFILVLIVTSINKWNLKLAKEKEWHTGEEMLESEVFGVRMEASGLQVLIIHEEVILNTDCTSAPPHLARGPQ